MFRATLATALGIGLLAGSASAQNGAVKGTVVWGGPAPEQKVLNVGASPDAAFCQAKGPVLDEEYVVNAKNKGLQWTFVWIAPQMKGAKMPVSANLKTIPADKKKVILDQPICAFIPHAVALREGQELVVKNSAKVAHNFKWTGNPSNSNGNVLLPIGGEHTIDTIKADRLPFSLECNIHPWMKGMMMCFDHPYFAVTDADGNFEIKDIPPGTYQLMVRHSNGYWLGGAKGKDGKTITVKAGDNAQGNIDFPPPG